MLNVKEIFFFIPDTTVDRLQVDTGYKKISGQIFGLIFCVFGAFQGGIMLQKHKLGLLGYF